VQGFWALKTQFVAAIVMWASISLAAQTPKPFPQPSPPPAPPGAQAPSQPQRPATPGKNAPAPAGDGVPTAATLGVAIFPNAQFITSYDAGRGQRFYLFGASTAFAEVVMFYRTTLKQNGEVLFESPPTHQFETGRFRDETMAFPPSVTIKDYTFGGSAGYPNPKKGTGPERFPTIIQIVPVPLGTPPGL
jgi:hypothetical protein